MLKCCTFNVFNFELHYLLKGEQFAFSLSIKHCTRYLLDVIDYQIPILGLKILFYWILSYHYLSNRLIVL